MKGFSLISAVLAVGIVIASITIALNVGMPLLDRMQDSNALQKNMDVLRDIDGEIFSVASGTERSSRTITISLQRGSYHFDNETGELYYNVETDSKIISANTTQKRGPITLTANKTGEEKTVQATLNYTDIRLQGEPWSFHQGVYDLVFTNTGIEDGKTAVNVTLS